MDYNQNSDSPVGKLVVKDASQVIGLYIASFVLVPVGALFLYVFAFAAETNIPVVLGCLIAILFGVVFFLMALSRQAGYVIDAKEGTLELSAIGDADGISDYFNPAYYKRLITRRKINLSDILQMSTSLTVNRDNQGKLTCIYNLNLQGEFGSIPLTFKTEGKRDQLVSYIRSINRMGIPVVAG